MSVEEKIRIGEIILLGAIFLVFTILLWTVIGHANDLIDKAAGGGFKEMKDAYDSAVVNTFVGPFEKIVGAFVIYAFGKLGFKVADNNNRMKNEKEPKKISFFG